MDDLGGGSDGSPPTVENLPIISASPPANQKSRHVWWVPKLGNLSVSPSGITEIVDNTDFKPVYSGVFDVRRPPGFNRTLATNVESISYAYTGNGLVAFEITYNRAPTGPIKRQTAQESAKWVSEQLGHQHIFHQTPSPPVDVLPSRISWIFALLGLMISLLLLNNELVPYQADFSVFHTSNNSVSNLAQWTEHIIPHWLVAFLIFAHAFWFVIVLASYVSARLDRSSWERPLKKRYFHDDRFFPYFQNRVLSAVEAATISSGCIWLMCWLLTNFAEQYLIDSGDGDKKWVDLLTDLKPRFFFSPEVNLEVSTLICTLIAASLVGFSALPKLLSLFRRFLKFTDHNESLHKKEFQVDIPEITDSDVSLANILVDGALKKPDSATLPDRMPRSPLQAILDAQSALLTSILLHVSKDEGTAAKESRLLNSAGRIVFFAAAGVVGWLMVAVAISQLQDDNVWQTKFGGFILPTLLSFTFAVAFAVWAAMSWRFIDRFCVPTLSYLQRAHGYFVHLDPLSKVIQRYYADPTDFKPSFATECEIIKVKQEASKLRLDQSRFWATFAIAMTSLFTTIFVAFLGLMIGTSGMEEQPKLNPLLELNSPITIQL